METLMIVTLFWGVPIYFVLRLKPDHLLLCLSGLWLFLHVLSLLGCSTSFFGLAFLLPRM
jgi:hypothetical protein